VVALLDHLLLTIGNGYRFDNKTGMIYEFGHNDEYKFVDQFPELTPEDWKNVIQTCHNKEQEYADQFGYDADQLKYDCEKYKIIKVDDSMFTEDSLYKDLVNMKKFNQDFYKFKTYVRPYPLSKSFSLIYKLNKNTPDWFIDIALNFCNAWIRFLDEEILNNNCNEDGYESLEYTTKHCGMLKSLVINLGNIK